MSQPPVSARVLCQASQIPRLPDSSSDEELVPRNRSVRMQIDALPSGPRTQADEAKAEANAKHACSHEQHALPATLLEFTMAVAKLEKERALSKK